MIATSTNVGLAVAERDATPNVVWRALPGSQALTLCCPAQVIFNDGTRGPGKTDGQLMLFRKNVGRGYGASWRGVIFDREYKNLDDMVQKSKRWFPRFGDGVRWLSSKSDYKWVWPTGEELLFRQMKREADYWNYHGQEFPFIGWNEITKHPSSVLYDAMMSCNRSSFIPHLHGPLDEEGNRIIIPDIPLVVSLTTNPYGPGHAWVKRRFVDPAPPGVPVATTIEVFNPRTQKREMVTKYQVRIFGSYKENIYLDPQYIATLESITDENKRKAWLYGDWDIVAGGAFEDVWGQHLILPRFKVPAHWKVTRSFDWGSSKPFSIGWHAHCNGEEATLPDGTSFCPPKGTVIRVFEWYGSKDGMPGLNEGIKMGSKKIAENIVRLEEELVMAGWFAKKPSSGPADNAIFDELDPGTPSIASKMEEAGVSWERSNKSPGSRIRGLQLWRDRMEASKDWLTEREDVPCWFVTANCRAAIASIPTLVRDPKNPDDVDTEQEDHLFDEGRYEILDADAGATDLSKLGVL